MAAAMQLRSFLGELGMVTLPYISLNGKLQKSLTEDGTSVDDEFATRTSKLLGELEWYMTALKNHKDAAGLPS